MKSYLKLHHFLCKRIRDEVQIEFLMEEPTFIPTKPTDISSPVIESVFDVGEVPTPEQNAQPAKQCATNAQRRAILVRFANQSL